jgi:hypothetical protein
VNEKKKSLKDEREEEEFKEWERRRRERAQGLKKRRRAQSLEEEKKKTSKYEREEEQELKEGKKKKSKSSKKERKREARVQSMKEMRGPTFVSLLINFSQTIKRQVSCRKWTEITHDNAKMKQPVRRGDPSKKEAVSRFMRVAREEYKTQQKRWGLLPKTKSQPIAKLARKDTSDQMQYWVEYTRKGRRKNQVPLWEKDLTHGSTPQGRMSVRHCCNGEQHRLPAPGTLQQRNILCGSRNQALAKLLISVFCTWELGTENTGDNQNMLPPSREDNREWMCQWRWQMRGHTSEREKKHLKEKRAPEFL